MVTSDVSEIVMLSLGYLVARGPNYLHQENMWWLGF